MLSRRSSSRLRRRGQRRPRLRLALVGADGAGKSTVSEMLERAQLPRPVKRIYMGVNLEASTLMLPTTRLMLAIKGARGGEPRRLDAALAHGSPNDREARGPGWRRTAREGLRLSAWMLEEWLRQLAAVAYSARGYIVVFDRHFFADYYEQDESSRGSAEDSVFSRLHRRVLHRAYPRPDLVVCLDAPTDVLFARKAEWDLAWLEQRRQQYLALADTVPAFAVVDADRPIDAVVSDVVDIIWAHWTRQAQPEDRGRR